MDPEEIKSVIRSSRAGDRLKLGFAHSTFNGDLSDHLYVFIAFDGVFFQMSDPERSALRSIAGRCRWGATRAFTIELLTRFDAEYFIHVIVEKNLLERVERV